MFLIWALIGSSCAVAAEAMMRSGYPWRENVVVYALLSVSVSYCVYRLLGASPGWLPGIVAFSAATSVLRIGVAFLFLHEPLNPINLVSAAALMGVTALNLHHTLTAR